MGVNRVEELLIWQRAERLAAAVSALTQQSALARDFRLRDQLNDAAASVLGNIAEGFGQGTDRAFAHHLFIARGSIHEVRAHLAVSLSRGYLEREDVGAMQLEAEEIARMLGGLIRYLLRSNRRDRY